MIRVQTKHPIYVRLRNALTQRAAVRAATINGLWLLTDKGIRLVGGLFVGMWVARYMAPNNFGLFNTLVAINGLAVTIGFLGIETSLVRYFIKYPNHEFLILGTAVRLRLMASGVAALAVCAIPFFVQFPSLSRWTWFVIAGTLPINSFSIIRQWFESRVASKYVVMAELAAFLISTLLKIIGVVFHFRVGWFVGVVVMEALFGLIAYGTMYLRQRTPIPWRFSGRLALVLLRQSWPLFLGAFAVIVYMKIDQVMVLSLAGSHAAGIYAAAARVSELTYFLPLIVFSSIFPAMTTLRKTNFNGYISKLQMLLSAMTLSAYAGGLLLTLCASFVISVLYGPEYADAAIILSVHIWALIWICQGLIGHIYILNEKLTRYALIKDAISAGINILLNLILIPRCGGLGAAIATFIAYSFAAFWGNALFPPLRPLFRLQLDSLRLKGLYTKLKELPANER